MKPSEHIVACIKKEQLRKRKRLGEEDIELSGLSQENTGITNELVKDEIGKETRGRVYISD